jgi:hypothetical protein
VRVLHGRGFSGRYYEKKKERQKEKILSISKRIF